MGKIESVVLVSQKSVICYIQMVVVALLSVYLVESVDLVSVDLVVNCIFVSGKSVSVPLGSVKDKLLFCLCQLVYP